MSSSSPPPVSGLTGHAKEARASSESAHGKEAEEEVTKPVKPEAAAAAEGEGGGAHICIKITSQTAPDVSVRVKRDVELQRIFDKYCGEHSLAPKAVVFLNEEKRIRGAQTAEEAGLEDGSEISVNITQLGGSGRA